MGYFDTLADNAFKQGPDGKVIFYPNGAISKGRVVPDEESRVTLYQFQKRTYKLALFLGIPYGWLLGFSGIFTIASLSPCILLLLYIIYKQYSLTHNLEKHDLKLGFGEAAKRGSHALPNWYYWFLGFFSGLMIIVGFTMPFLLEKRFSDFIYLVIGFVSFGLIGLGLSIKLYELKNLKRS